jgi:hypothetical protein
MPAIRKRFFISGVSSFRTTRIDFHCSGRTARLLRFGIAALASIGFVE